MALKLGGAAAAGGALVGFVVAKIQETAKSNELLLERDANALELRYMLIGALLGAAVLALYLLLTKGCAARAALAQ